MHIGWHCKLFKRDNDHFLTRDVSLWGPPHAVALFIASIDPFGSTGKLCGAAGFTPENHLEEVAGYEPDTILMIDAAEFQGSPGDIRLIGIDDLLACGISTHAGSPQILARYLQSRTGARVVLLAIQPAETSQCEELSEAVASAMKHVVQILPLYSRR